MSTIVEIHRMLTDGAINLHTKQCKHGSMLDMFKVQSICVLIANTRTIGTKLPDLYGNNKTLACTKRQDSVYSSRTLSEIALTAVEAKQTRRFAYIGTIYSMYDNRFGVIRFTAIP